MTQTSLDQAIHDLEMGFQATRQRWLDARELWTDATARYFEQTYWQPIQAATAATQAELQTLQSVILVARRNVK